MQWPGWRALLACLLAWSLAAAAPAAATPDPADPARAAMAAAVQGCHEWVPSTEARRCWVVRGRASQPVIMLFGDSHAHHLHPALAEIAQRHGMRLAQLTKSGCPAPSVHTETGKGDPHPQCFLWRESALALMARMKPAVVVVASSYHYNDILLDDESGAPVGPDYLDTWGAGMRATLTSIAAGGPDGVIVVRDTPRFADDLLTCLSSATAKERARSCGLPTDKALDRNNRQVWDVESAIAAGSPGTTLLDLTDEFCDSGVCSPTNPDGESRYLDANHLSAPFAASLWRRFSAVLAGVTQMRPSTVPAVRVKRARGRVVVRWGRPMPGSGTVRSYTTRATPIKKWRNRGVKGFSCSGPRRRCRSGVVPPRASYRIRVMAVSEIGRSPAARARLR